MAAADKEFAAGYQSAQVVFNRIRLSVLANPFLLSLVICYFLSISAIVGASFSRLFFRPSGNVRANTVESSST